MELTAQAGQSAGAGFDWMGLVALVIAALAFVASGISIGWNIFAWLNSGPRLKVRTSWSVIAYTYKDTATGLGVSVSNAGRLETRIESITFPYWRTREKNIERVLVVLPPAFVGGALPQVIGPGAEESYIILFSTLVGLMYENDVDPTKMKVAVKTGHGTYEGKLSEGLVELLQKELAAFGEGAK